MMATPNVQVMFFSSSKTGAVTVRRYGDTLIIVDDQLGKSVMDVGDADTLIAAIRSVADFPASMKGNS